MISVILDHLEIFGLNLDTSTFFFLCHHRNGPSLYYERGFWGFIEPPTPYIRTFSVHKFLTMPDRWVIPFFGPKLLF